MTRERVLKLPVLEIFGPTFQGEGRAIGQKDHVCKELQDVIITVIGVILLSLGMVQKKPTRNDS